MCRRCPAHNNGRECVVTGVGGGVTRWLAGRGRLLTLVRKKSWKLVRHLEFQAPRGRVTNASARRVSGGGWAAVSHADAFHDALLAASDGRTNKLLISLHFKFLSHPVHTG